MLGKCYDVFEKMSDYYGEYFESVKTSYSEALHNALENSGSEETLSTFMQQYMQDQMADFDFSTVMENYGPIERWNIAMHCRMNYSLLLKRYLAIRTSI